MTDEYDWRWRLKTGALAVGVVLIGLGLVTRTDPPVLFYALWWVVVGAILFGAAIGPNATLPWRRKQRRPAWAMAAGFSLPIFVVAVPTVFTVPLVVDEAGWSLAFGLIVVFGGTLLTLWLLRGLVHRLDDPERGKDK